MSKVASRLLLSIALIFLTSIVFVSSSEAQLCAPDVPHIEGEWTTLPYLMPINPISTTLLHNGKVLMVPGSENDAWNNSSGSDSYRYAIWDPAGSTQSSITVNKINYDVFCSGTAALPDGRALVVGGSSSYVFTGDNRSSIFDPVTESFMQSQSMANGRWYGTITALGDGRTMAFSGLSLSGGTNNTVEIYDLKSAGAGWTSPTAAPFTPPLYPRMFLLPNGKVFYNGYGDGTSSNARIFDPTPRTWALSAPTTTDRGYGSAVLLPLLAPSYTPKVINFGGGGNSSTEIIDLSVASPSYTPGPNMSTGRIESNAVILPNGKVLVEGGSVNNEVPDAPGRSADLYDPANNTFSSGGTASFSRLYHSTALLLPDATVMSMGSNPGSRGSYEPAIEIYRPPYLFNANDEPVTDRPAITGVSAGVIGYNTTFSVNYSSSSAITSAVLVRPGSSTHAFDNEQRLIGLCGPAPQPACNGSSGTLALTSPPNGNIAPPGYYMLFLLDSAGVPSIAQFIQLSLFTTVPPDGIITSPASNPTITAGQAVSFGTTTSAAQYSWVFPGGSTPTSTAQNPLNVTFNTPGTYVVSLTVIDSSGNSDPSPSTRTITVLPTTANSNFSIAVSPTSVAVVPGQSATFTVTVTSLAGFKETVNLSVGSESGFPTGITSGGFSPASITSSGSSTLTINTTTSAKPYALSLTITGATSTITHTTSTTLLVNLAPPASLTATAGNAQVALSWPATNGANGYNIKRGPIAGGPYVMVGCASTTSYTDTGLVNGKTYYYVVSATYGGNPNAGGESRNSIEASATPIGSTPPPPTGLTATPGNGQVSLNWNASTGASSYNVKRATVNGGPYNTIASPFSTNHTDSTVSNGTTYYYVVSALNSGGESANSSQVSATPQASAAGLVAAYAFNEGSGTTLTDISGNNNNGTISGATWTTTGKYGNALVFNGTNARVSIPSSASLNTSTALTLQAWIMPTVSQNDWRTIIQKEDVAYFLHASNSNGPLLPAGGATVGGTNAWVSGTTASPVNVWTHLALTYGSATVRLYVNGVQVASQAATGTIQTTTNPLWIGGNSLYGEYFQGRIDEVRIYNRALSQSEIQADMNTPIGGVNTAPTISSIVDQATNEDTATSAIAFTVGDKETAAGSLTVSGTSSNTTLVPNANIVFGGSGANRTVTLTPALNQSGTTTITVTVSDGQLSTPTSFVLTVNAVNDVPTITTIANQSTTSGTPVGPLSFTVGDVETAAGSLTVSGTSSNTTLVPNANIAFGGSGANRTVTVTPAAAQTGTATITVTVNDGQVNTSTNFDVTVTATNTVPTISTIADQGTNEDIATGAIAFTVGDKETAAGSLTVSGSSSNTTLIPNGNIVFGGSGANRTVTLTPALNQNGTTTITVTVSDGQLSTPTSFVLTVTAVNDVPTITTIANQSTTSGTPVGPLNFTIGDVETAAASLTLSGSSSNTTLVPNANIVFGGSGANRTVTVTPAAGQTGTATITITVSDGSANTPSSFPLTVNAVSTGLVAAYAFNEGSGTTLTDISGNNNNGTISGATWTTTGKYGNALVFNGTNARVSIPSSASLNASTALTLQAWIMPTVSQNDWRTIIQKEDVAYFLHASNSNGPLLPAGGATVSGTNAWVSGTTASPVNVWTHLALTYGSATVRLYVNGVQVASQAATGTIQTTTNPLWIGGNSLYGEYFQGRIDEVRIYNRALSQSEIQADMNTPIGGASAGTLQFSLATYSVNENIAGGNATITVTRTGGSAGAVGATFSTTTGGTATAGLDYTTTTQTVSFANGDSADKTVTIPILDETTFEGNETVNLALSSPTGGATLGNQSTAVLTIVDNDPAPAGTLQFSSATYSVNENGTNATITVTRTGGSAGAVGASFTTDNGTATAGSDYTTTTQTVSFADGDTTNKTVSIPILDDTVFEGNETVNLTLSSPTGGATLGSPSTAVLTIVDNEAAPAGTLQFSSATYSVNENGAIATITVTRTGGSAGAVGASFTTGNGTATAGSDYTTTTQTVSFADGDTANKTVTIPILDDTLFEGNETVNLTLSSPTGGAALGSPSTAVLTIVDNEAAPAGTLQFSSATYSVNENGAIATITVTRTGGSAGAVGASFTTGNGTATAGSDYTTTTQTVSFADGDTANKTVTVPILDDTVFEGNETVNLTLSSPTGGATLGATSTAVLTIVENDAAPAGSLQFSSATYSVNENGANATVTITRTGGSVGAVGASFTTGNGTATAGSDYTTTTQTVSFADGDTANKTVTIPILDDTLFEGNETVNLTLSSPTGGAALGSPSTAVLTIVDNEAAPAGTLQFSSATYSVNENGAIATITVTRTGGSAGAVGASFTTGNGTATAGSDYTTTTQTVSFADGDTADKTVTIPILDDTVFEGNETVNLTLSSPTGGATLGSPSTAVLTIVDNDNPVPSLTGLVPNGATAGGAAFTLTVNGSNFVSSSVVQWNGTARTTTFVSTTQLTAAIPASDIATGGTVQVTVVNPTPGGGTSNVQSFSINFMLTVSKTGNGTVTSAPAGINCGGDCSEPYTSGTIVTLTATPQNKNFTFVGWSGGGCSGTGTCSVTMDANKTVTATFGRQ